MAKKKKTQLKPVARGFATTSVPKKVIPVQEQEPEADAIEHEPAEASVEAGQEAALDIQQQPEKDGFDLDKVEEQSLQNLVDKFQDKLEKDIKRTIKGIKADLRFADTLPRLDLDESIVDRILQLVKKSESDGNDVGKSVDASEEKAIPRLGLTYGVLRRLGFSEARVVECLTSIRGIDLDEAYDWLFLHCTEDELLNSRGGPDDDRASQIGTTTMQSVRGTHAPRSPSTSIPLSVSSRQFRPPPSPSELPKELSGQSRPSRRSDAQILIATPLQPYALEDRNQEPVNHSKSAASTPDGPVTPSDTSTPDEDPNAEYVRLRLKLDDASSWRKPAGLPTDNAFIEQLQCRLKVIQSDYFFDKVDAEAQYRKEREAADDLMLHSRLRSNVKPVTVSSTKVPSPLHTPVDSTVTTEARTSPDFFEADSEEGDAGMLDLLDEIPTVSVSDSGTIVQLRTMALPKQTASRLPKKYLADMVIKADGYAIISYRSVSGPSRAKRAGVTIRWIGGKVEDWTMEDVACPEMEQAEQYISTVALHAMTFPLSDGFAAGASGAANSQTFFRLFPPAFRELWDELEVKRKSLEDAINRRIWSELRTIVEPKLTSEPKPADKTVRIMAENKSASIRRGPGFNRDSISEQLVESFKARQSSVAYQEMLLERNTLPIAQYRQSIVDTLEHSQVMVLSGETGCGKSTQVPAFILEDQLSRGNHCKIYCTEPRRISAISLAQRVSRELGDAPGAVGTMNSLVGYSIRLESNISRNTRLAFVTNGIALRMLEGGSGQGGHGTAFDEITHIIIDEVHERTIESDFLLIVLKSLLQQRSDLKIVLMSATVDSEKLSNYFGGCPVLHVPGRTFPVDIRFLEDAVELTHWSINESSPYAKRLNDKFHRGKTRADWSEENAVDIDDDEEKPTTGVALGKRYSPQTATTMNTLDERIIPYDLLLRLLERICFGDAAYASYSSAILIFLPGLGEIRRLNDALAEHPRFSSDYEFVIYPLHSTISSENQGAVFNIPPLGIRKIVIATNIAETGITIPDITCVIDSGKHREMRQVIAICVLSLFDEKRQISRLVETFVARSNAAQRRGRAGRVQNGLCFHLFTKTRHDTQMADHPDPEMMRLSLSDLALRIKIMKVDLGSSIEDALSRALDPPSSINIQRAVSVLVEVRALTPAEEITPLGRLLSMLPTDVHLGKFLLIATLFRCLDPALTIAATLNSKSPFLTPLGHEAEADLAKSSFRTENSDFLTLHNAFSSWRRACANPGFVRKFCRTNFLSHQNLQQIEELRQQFIGYLVDSGFIQVDPAFVKDLTRARYGRNRSKLVLVPGELDINSTNSTLLNAALAAGLYPKILSINPVNGHLTTVTNGQLVAPHPSSVNFRRRPSDFGVNYLVYFTLMQSKKLYAWETSPVEDMAIALLCGESDVKLIADSLFIDRKIRFHVSPKINLALKYLRGHLASLLATQLRGKPLTETQALWMEIALIVLGKMRLEKEQPQRAILDVIVH
ncbi:P-loop containing nucleoside triphosphate hydrolase protein [Amylostereum chailletii]|nr:P-loop containing nucleoside triphosphate hydrolase protein [Amylostereum chailletii]